MSKNENQKLKLIYIYDLLYKKTDEDHGITVKEIINALEKRGISAERKSVYDDINTLRDLYGADIETYTENRANAYRLMSREFELVELKLLTDAVQSSKFITHKKSDELIRKLENLTSEHLAKNLRGQVYVANRIKSMNESIYYNVNSINEAISSGKKITFFYFDWLANGKKKLRRDGALYTVSPWCLCWDNENYYLVGYEAGSVKHYRVDKMQNIICTDQNRDGIKEFENFDPAAYTGKMFSMFGGREESVTLNCDNALAGAIIDRFGKNVMMIPNGDTFNFTCKVVVSPQFFAWLSGFSGKVRISSPKPVIEEYKTYLKSILEQY